MGAMLWPRKRGPPGAESTKSTMPTIPTRWRPASRAQGAPRIVDFVGIVGIVERGRDAALLRGVDNTDDADYADKNNRATPVGAARKRSGRFVEASLPEARREPRLLRR